MLYPSIPALGLDGLPAMFHVLMSNGIILVTSALVSKSKNILRFKSYSCAVDGLTDGLAELLGLVDALGL